MTESDMTEIKTTSPAYNRQRVDGDNSLVELSWIGKINLRGNPDDKDFVAKAGEALGCDLPMEPNTLIENNGKTVFWLGPNEWLVYCDIDGVNTLTASLKSALEDIHHAVTDVSDYYTVLKLEGPAAATLLNKACPLDLHKDVFKSSTCAQTRFGHASILLHKLNNVPTFHVQVRWSYTEYVWDYFLSAMATLGD